MKTILVVMFILVVFFVSPVSSFSFDGTNWNRFSIYEKEAYLLGVYDGLLLQRLYGDQYTQHIVWNMSNFEKAKELDSFYSDSKNLSIEVGEALILSSAGSKGLSHKEIEEIKKVFRTIKSK